MADNKLRYYITGNAAGLNKALTSASGRVQAFGQKLKSVGASLQRFSVIGGLAGGAAIKMGVDFDRNITKIKALVGGTEEDFKAFENAARRMAKVTGISSKNTSDAMFFIASAGLTGKKALEVLEMSAKASASGLGDVAVVADLSTSAMNAFGISATEATDVLTASVREGKLSADTLAAAMGAVLPTASAMDVEFHEVGAAMAAMSRTGTDAAQGATQLNAILSAILKTTPATDKAFGEMGLSAAGLRQQISEEGLLSVLDTLRIAIDGNAKAAGDIFPNLRALRGVLDLTGKGAAVAGEIFNDLEKSAGATAEAFDVTSQSASFRLTQAMNDAKESFAEVGSILLQTLLPLLKGFAGAIKTLFEKFKSLNPQTQKLITGLGVIALALPFLISAFGTLISVVSALFTPVGLIAAALAGIAYIIHKNWAEVAPVLVGLYNRFVDLYNASETFRKVIWGIKAVFKSVFIAVKGVIGTFINGFQTAWKLIKEFSEKGIRGSYLKILKEGFGKGKDIVVDSATDIGNEFTDSMTNAVGSTLEHKTVEQLNTALSGLSGKAKEMFNKFMSGLGFGDAITSTVDTSIDTTTTDSGEESEVEKKLTEEEKRLQAKRQKALDNAKQFNQELSGIIEAGLENMAVGIGQALGQAMAGAGGGVQSLGAVLLGGIGSIAEQVGKMAIGIGIALEGIKKALESLNPFVAIAAGIALVALGSFFKSKSASISESMGAKKFAKGGIVSTPTLGLMGEYPGARSNPEVIAPLDRLKSMIGENGGGHVQVGGEFTLKGQDLVVALQRADRNRNRIK